MLWNPWRCCEWSSESMVRQQIMIMWNLYWFTTTFVVLFAIKTFLALCSNSCSNTSGSFVWLQIVALNFQTRDDPLMLNYGFFEDNGACGYVLKPDFMRSTSSNFSLDGPIPSSWTQILKIRVISGYKLPRKEGDSWLNILDPYVRVNSHAVYFLL